MTGVAVEATPTPVRGPLFCRAAAIDAGGMKRRRLLALLAAYQDAGCDSPPARRLIGPVGCRNVRGFDGLLKALERDGWITVAWRAGPEGRNVYALHLHGGGPR